MWCIKGEPKNWQAAWSMVWANEKGGMENLTNSKNDKDFGIGMKGGVGQIKERGEHFTKIKNVWAP